MVEKSKFDESYYHHYYGDARTRVATPRYFRDVANFISAYCRLMEIKVRSMVDLGCGTGTLHRPLLNTFEKAAYTGVELSEYACAVYGWEQACLSEFWSPKPFDLVVCHDVVQYLDDKRASAAIDNFAELCGGVLYFSVLTEEDWQKNCDQQLTDSKVNLRLASWYRKRLSAHFRNLGGGIYLPRNIESVVYELEALD